MQLADCFANVTTTLRAQVPVYCLSPSDQAESIRFYDTSALDSSRRYLAITRFGNDTRLPQPGEPAKVIVRDLQTGADIVTETTTAWDSQLGAQVQWHPNRPEVFFNTMDATGMARAVSIDVATGARTEYAGSLYMLSPDARRMASPDLRKTGYVQAGYGVIVADAPRNTGAPDDDGVWVTECDTGRHFLAVSLRHLAEAADLGDPDAGQWYTFHVKWNPVRDRLLVVVRWLLDGGKPQRAVVACDSDGSNVHCIVSADQWAAGGHHPNWLPDGRGIIMNLRPEPDGPLRFVLIDDSPAAPWTVIPYAIGSGHPTLSRAMTHLLSDAYPNEPMARDGCVPLRWIDLKAQSEHTLAWINANPAFAGPKREWRVDPHPAWCMDGRHVIFNGWHKDCRRVFLADLSGLVNACT